MAQRDGNGDEPQGPNQARPRRVLVIEDDEELRALLADYLGDHGFEVELARDGGEALERLGSLLQDDRSPWEPELVITDYRMPKFDGIDVIEALRLASVSAPIILVTAYGDPAMHRRATALGVRAVLDKPFVLSELLSLAQGATAQRV